MRQNDEVMTFYIQKVKDQLAQDIITFCKNTFLVIIQHHSSLTEGGIVTAFLIESDTILITTFSNLERLGSRIHI